MDETTAIEGQPHQREQPHSFASATELLAALGRRELSSRELLEASLQRIERHNPTLNAVVTLDTERARLRARRRWRRPSRPRPAR